VVRFGLCYFCVCFLVLIVLISFRVVCCRVSGSSGVFFGRFRFAGFLVSGLRAVYAAGFGVGFGFRDFGLFELLRAVLGAFGVYGVIFCGLLGFDGITGVLGSFVVCGFVVLLYSGDLTFLVFWFCGLWVWYNTVLVWCLGWLYWCEWW